MNKNLTIFRSPLNFQSITEICVHLLVPFILNPSVHYSGFLPSFCMGRQLPNYDEKYIQFIDLMVQNKDLISHWLTFIQNPVRKL